jgi:7-cyano-7-deazaguanine synthase in queuosine biosynthesis
MAFVQASDEQAELVRPRGCSCGRCGACIRHNRQFEANSTEVSRLVDVLDTIKNEYPELDYTA